MLFALLLACDAQTAEPPPMPDTVHLAAFEAQVQGAQLTVSYRVTNGTAESVWLFNRLFERGLAGHEPQVDKAYTRLDGDTLVLTKAWREVPDHLDVEAPEVPFLTPLAAGASFEERFAVQVPVAAVDPYAPQPAGSTVAKDLRFELGWAGPALVPREGRTPAGPAPRAHHRDARKHQQLLVGTAKVEVATAMAVPTEASGR